MANAPQLDEAIRLADRKDNAGALRILAQYLQANPKDEFAWLWLAYLLPDRAQQQQALQQCLKFFPDSQSARDDQDSLRLGASLSRPIPPPPFPPTSSKSAFLERDLFLDESDQEASPSQAFTKEMGDSPDVQRAFSSEHQPRLEPRLKQPAPKPEPTPEPEWERMLTAEPTPTPIPQANVAPRRSHQQNQRQAVRRPTPKKKSTIKGWQVGCLGLMLLLTLGALIGGGWLIIASTSGNDIQLPSWLSGISTGQTALITPSPSADVSIDSEPTPSVDSVIAVFPTQEPTPTSAITEPVVPTATSWPLPEIDLPAPLYYLSDSNGSTQIWRLEADGSSLIQVTNEKHPVTAFDISPADGQLAYISNNSLYLMNADGTKRRTLVYGQPLPAQEDPTYWKLLLTAPLWSPDGASLAYAQDGIQVIDPATTVTIRIEPNLYVPTNPERTRLYFPLTWSPEGSRIAVSVMRHTCNTLGIVFSTGYSTLDQIALAQGQPSWSDDGLSLLVASPFADCTCGSGSGLFEVSAADGKIKVLSGGLVKQSTPASFVGWPKAMPDGTLLYFYGEAQGPACTPNWPSSVPLAMVVSPSNKLFSQIALRTDSYIMGEALWAADGSLAVIRDLTDSPEAEFGVLLILNGDGSPAIELSMPGRSLHWGLAVP